MSFCIILTVDEIILFSTVACTFDLVILNVYFLKSGVLFLFKKLIKYTRGLLTPVDIFETNNLESLSNNISLSCVFPTSKLMYILFPIQEPLLYFDGHFVPVYCKIKKKFFVLLLL